MATLIDIKNEILFHQNYELQIRDLIGPIRRLTYVDILVVVEENISVHPSNDFGITQVIDLIRKTKIGCMRFRVDIALRNLAAQSIVASPSPTQHKYLGFRFDMMDSGTAVIDKYEQIWCFGFKPSNSGSASDAEIDAAAAMPASNAELLRLDQWMTEKKGGLFGTGDHHFLGASMCRKIPRLGTMRRWTNADGVPPQGRSELPNPQNRIDTLRPPSAQYLPGAPGQLSLENNAHQGDLVVQPIQWVADQSNYINFFKVQKRPHPVLCHPTLGPIDVMPDHAHEGLCVPHPDLGAKKKFKNELEYPEATDGGAKPGPKIIAYGSNLGQDPYKFAKGVQPARDRNPMIAVYDGHRAGVGRVATDSTWHHWMDVNINEIRAANTVDWQKISRYFQNLAVWLNPPGFSTSCFYTAVVASHFQAVGMQDFAPKASVFDLGTSLRRHLQVMYGPCWVTETLWLVLDDLKLIERVPFRLPPLMVEDDLPELAALETLILGQMVEATMPVADRVKEAGSTKKAAAMTRPSELFAEAARKGIEQYVAQVDDRAMLQKEAMAKLMR